MSLASAFDSTTGDQLLLSGFISAIFGLTSFTGEEIESVKLKNTEIFYKKDANFIIALQIGSNKKIRKNLQNILEKISECLRTSGKFLLEDEGKIVNTEDIRHIQLVEKIDNIIEFKPLTLEHDPQQIRKIIEDYLTDILDATKAAEQLRQSIGEQSFTGRARKMLKLAIEELSSTIEHIELSDRAYSDKLNLLMNQMYNWLDYAKEFVKKGW